MDPERPIEKLLRQAAQARRGQAGAPQEMHPATRRMMQGEVARKFASGAPRERRSLFELLMPRLAWSAALVVALGLAASLMLPRKNAPRQEMLFAKNDRVTVTANEAKRPAGSAPAESLAAAPAQRSDSSALTQANSARLADAERDKDALNVERRRAESERAQSVPLNEPAPAAPGLAKGEAQPAPRSAFGEGGNKTDVAVRQSNDIQLHTATVGGSLGREKQKEQLTDAFNATPPPQTPVTEENMNQRRYGLARPAQSAPAPAASAGVAASSALKPGDETSKTELADRLLAQQTGASPSSLGVQLKSAAAVDAAKRGPIAQVTQKFVQSALLKKSFDLSDKSAAAQPILYSFELQQLGREIRIIDGDGSVYTGSFQPPETFNYLDSTLSEKAAATRSLQTAEAQPKRKDALSDSKLQTDMSFAFKVSGTNQTLKQIVTFTGEVLAPTNALSLVGPAGTVNGNRAAPPELNPLPLQNSRISGKALIGINKEVEVNAIPAH